MTVMTLTSFSDSILMLLGVGCGREVGHGHTQRLNSAFCRSNELRHFIIPVPLLPPPKEIVNFTYEMLQFGAHP